MTGVKIDTLTAYCLNPIDRTGKHTSIGKIKGYRDIGAFCPDCGHALFYQRHTLTPSEVKAYARMERAREWKKENLK